MEIDFKKYPDGLVPAIVQDDKTGKVLMLGFMNEAAVARTNELRQVTFFSRTKTGSGPKEKRAEIFCT